MLMPKKVKFRKTSPRPHAGQGRARQHAVVRRVRPAGPGVRLADRPPARSRPHHHHPVHEAARQAVAAGLPLEARDQETDRGPHGQGQGRPGILGRRHQARPDHLSRSKASPRTWPARPCAWPPRSFPMMTRFVSRENRELR